MENTDAVDIFTTMISQASRVDDEAKKVDVDIDAAKRLNRLGSR